MLHGNFDVTYSHQVVMNAVQTKFSLILIFYVYVLTRVVFYSIESIWPPFHT